MISVIFLLRRRKGAQGVTSSTVPELGGRETPTDKKLQEMYEDYRPFELSARTLHELSEQNLQEMEQSPQRMKLHEHEPSELLRDGDYS